MRRTRKLRKSSWALLVPVVVGGGVWTYEAQAAARQVLRPYLAQQLSTVLEREVSLGKVSFWPLGSVSLRDVRVAPGPDDVAAPLVARQVRVYPSWWRLVVQRRVLIRELHLDGAHLQATIDTRKPQTQQVDAAETLRSLSRLGLRKVGLHDSRADVTTLLATGERQPVRADGLDLVVDLRREDFGYRARAAGWSGAGLDARDLVLRGSGDGKSLTVADGRAEFHGGRLGAKGTYVAENGDLAMQVQVTGLPLAGLGPQLGIPKEWDVKGTLTGAIDVTARTGEIRALQGGVAIARGSLTRSNTVFPWTNATARVDWRPDRILLKDIDVEGDQLRLKGSADVGGAPDTPFPQRPYQARGTVEASSSEAVSRLAQLMAFSTPVHGSWDLDHAAVSFQASGVAGALEKSLARGRFSAAGLMVRPTEKGEPLVVRTLEGDVERGPERLHVRNLRATADGLQAKGAATLVPAQPGRAGRFNAGGQIDLVNLNTFRKQAPQLPFWQWVEPATAASRGRLTFNVQGPTASPKQLVGSAGFRFQNFGASIPLGSAKQRWQVPMRELTGQARLAGGDLALSNVALRSDLFSGSGAATVSNLGQGGRTTGAFRMVSDRWAELEPLRGKLPAGLSGGRLVVDARLPEGSGKAPLQGALDLRGATYRTTAGGRARTVQVQEANATFRLADGRLAVPAYRLVTPQFRTSGAGSGKQAAAGGAWLLHAEGSLAASDAAELARWWSGSSPVTGGKLTARYVVDAPTSDPNRVALTARVRLTDAQPKLAAGALPFAPADTHINALTGVFHMEDGKVRFSDAVWQAPRFRAAGDGSYDGKNIAGAFRLSTPAWRNLAGELARSLPVSGGTLTVSGTVQGPADRLRDLPVDGTLALRGARLESDRNASLPVEGGSLDLTARVRGPLTRLVGADVDGSFTLRDLGLPALRPGAARVRIENARGRFNRTGSRVSLTDLVASAPGARLTGSGELRGVGTGAASHAFRLEAAGPALAGLLPAFAPVPGKASGGRFTGSLTVSGTAAQPTQRAEGRAEVRNAAWTPPGQTVAMKIHSATAHFVRTGSQATLDNVELRVQGGEATLSGTVQGLGTPGGPRHSLRLAWRLEDASAWASRLLPIPGWFTGGTFTGKAQISGVNRDPAQNASGTFQVTDAGFMPPQRFLGGPVKPIGVRWAKGVFSRANGKTAMNDLDLNTSVGMATGRVVSDDRGIADLTARADIRKLEALVDLWPGFANRLRGGRGELVLALRGPLRRPRELAGTVDIIGRDGVLTVENVDELYATQPFDEFSTRLLLSSGGGVRLDSVKLRGPRANLDGQGTVTADGRVQAKGKAWFSEAYTKQLIKPKFLRPLARLVGIKRIKSDYKVSGTLQEARLDMDITRSLLWKTVIKKKVPEPLRNIATGDAPIWSGDGAANQRVAGR